MIYNLVLRKVHMVKKMLHQPQPLPATRSSFVRKRTAAVS
jgi:hypothetical protein